MNPKFSKIIALALIQCQLSMMLPAEELRTDLRRGMARLEHYLDRAAAERRAQDWDQLARSGLEAAMYEWESGALWLLERDEEAWREEREQAELSYRKETEAAYVRWASGRAYSERAAFEGSGLGAALRAAAADWSYGDSGRIVNLADAGAARAAWEQVAGEIVDRYLAGWEEAQGLVHAELESRFRDLGLSDEERQALILGVAAERRALVDREYGRIALAEGNRLMAELLYDHGSMKKLAAAEAASVIARELAREAEAATEERAKELFTELDTMFSSEEEEEGISLAADDWLNRFRGAFEEGLARWEEAELGFLAARAEWEHDAEDAYLAGEEAWNNAYRELSDRQKAWEAAILLKLDEGFAKWQEDHSRLTTEIETARNEFLAASEESRKVKEKMLDSQAEIYIRSRQMLDMVRQGIESWYDLWNEKYLMVYTLIKQAAAHTGNQFNNFSNLDENIYKSLIDKKSLDIDELTNPHKDNMTVLRSQIELWKEACLALKAGGRSLPASIDALLAAADELLNEESGWLSLAARYREYADTAAERLYRLTGAMGETIEGYSWELETELLKAGALLSYWDDELEVAEALNYYAQETSSIIEDAAKTQEELENAKGVYEESVRQYEASLEALREKGLVLDKAQEDFETARAVLAGLREAVEEAQRDYANILAAIKDMNPAPVYDELANLGLAILAVWEGKTSLDDEADGAKTIEESILAYYRLSHDYADMLRTLEINAMLESLETGAGLGQPGLAELEAKAEEARLLAQSNREEDLRAAAGLYPAGVPVSIYWGGGEISLYQNGRELLIALDQAFRESTSPKEQEILLTLMRQAWQEAAAWYEEEAELRRQAIEYLKTGALAEIDEEALAESESRVLLEGLLAALQVTLDLGLPDSVSREELTALIQTIEDALSSDPGEAIAALAMGNQLFIDAMTGSLVLPDEAYAAAWIAQREARRTLGLAEAERVQLIRNRYGSYDAGDTNRKNQEAREAVRSLIAALQDGSRDTAGREGALDYAAELRVLGQGLNQLGQEALEMYIAAFLEYAAVRDYRVNPTSESDLSLRQQAYAGAGAAYQVYTAWQYQIYDEAGLAEIAGSGEFARLNEQEQEAFIIYALSKDYAALTLWAGRIIQAAHEELFKAADALVYAQYYQREKEGGLFAWIAELASYKNQMSECGIGDDTLEKIAPLFAAGAADKGLESLKNKIFWTGVWFTGDDAWNQVQYQEGLGETEAEQARAALESGWQESMNGITWDAYLYSMVNRDLERLLYMAEGGEALNRQKDQKKAALDKALDEYNTYLDQDYDLAVAFLDQSCVDYNDAVDEADSYYRAMAAARLHLRKRQEIQDWASSIYLKDFGINYEENYLSPLEKSSQVRYARERALMAVEVLREILEGESPHVDGEYHEAMESYKESRRRYYLAQVAAYETATALARQQGIVREAELAEEAARRDLVVYTGPVAPGNYELVNVLSDGNGGYRIELTYTLQDRYIGDVINSFDPDASQGFGYFLSPTAVRKPNTASDAEAFRAYFDDRTVALERVDTPESITMAEYEASEWLKRIGAIGIDYYDDVMLASLYIRYCAADGSAEGRDWFKTASDPRSGGTYTLGDIPLSESVHGLNLRAEYDSARRTVLQDAYNRVMSRAGGEEDIARYLLYRNRNIIGNAADYEESLLKSRALKLVDNAIGKTYRNYTTAFKVAMGIGAALTATGVALTVASIFNPGLATAAGIAFAGAAAAFFTAGVLDFARDQLDNIRDGVRNIQNGVNQNLDGGNGYNTRFKNNYSEWEQTLAHLAEERKVLNRMMYGTDDKPPNADSELSYGNFRQGLSALLNNGRARSALSFGEGIDLYSEELFNASGAKAGSTITGALKILNAVIEQESLTFEESLDGESERLMAAQEQNIALYDEVMNSALIIPQDRQEELRALALRAGDPSLDIAERRNAALEYERLIEELCGKTEDRRAEIRGLLENTFGDDTWNSEWHAANLMGLEGELFNSKILHTRAAETYTENEIVLLRASALSALDKSSSLALSVKEREWELTMADFLNQYYAWQEQVEQIRQAGLSEWTKARSRMNEGYNNWRKSFSDEYQAKADAWDLNYLEFVTGKQQWVDDQYLYAVSVGNVGLFDYTESDAAQIVAQTLARLSIEQMNRETIDPSAYTDMLLEDSILGELLSRMDDLDGRTGGSRVQTAAKRTSDAQSLAQASKVLDLMSDDMQKAAAKLAVQEAQKLIDEAIRQFRNRLAAENKAMWEWEERLVQANGYRIDGEIWRQAIVDTTAFEDITRTQTVHRYQDYKPGAEPVSAADMSAAALNDLDAEGIMRVVDLARWNLDKWGETIFGRLDAKGNILEHRIPRGFGELGAAGYAEIASTEKNRVDDLVREMNKFEERDFDSLSKEEKEEYEKLANQLITVRDGELGAHIGYGPVLKDEVDYHHSPIDDALDRGAGELGRILLDFMWNSRISTMGYLEASKAFYDQKLWAGELIPGLNINSFTFRDVLSLAGTVGSTVVSAIATPVAGALVGMIDDLFLGAFDMGLSYRSPEDVLKSLALSAGTSAASLGLSALGNTELVKSLGEKAFKPLADIAAKDTVLAKVLDIGKSAASSYTGAAAMNFMGSYDFSTGKFDADAFVKSLYSAQTLSGVIGSVLSTQLSGYASKEMSTADNKLYGGLVNLAIAGYSEAARYGVYAIDSLINGSGDFLNRLGQAYDNMEGITLNLANLGSILDFAGTLSYRLGENYDTRLEALGQILGNTGLLELNLGRGSASLSLGTDGIDLGGNLYRTAKYNLDYAVLMHGNYTAERRDLLTTAYLNGDWALENTAMRIEADRDRLWLGMDSEGNPLPENAMGHTTRRTDEQQGRDITIADWGDTNSSAIRLQHEAHRDGYRIGDNDAELVKAVLAHTEMAARMLQDGLGFLDDGNILTDLLAYSLAADGKLDFAQYVLGTYDNSDEYWRVILDEERKVIRVFKDEEYRKATIVEADGTERTVELQDGSLTAALAAAVGNGMTGTEMNAIMTEDPHLDFDNESRLWYAVDDEGKYVPPAQPEEAAPEIKPTKTGLLQGFFDWVGDTAGKVKEKLSTIPGKIERGFNKAKSGVESFLDTVKGLFQKSDRQAIPEQLTDMEQNDTFSDMVLVNRGDSLSFWNSLMTDAVKNQYAFTTTGEYNCNRFARDVIREYFGAEVYGSIFGTGWANTNTMFEEFKTNPNLAKIDTNAVSMEAIQEMADRGLLILMIYKNPDASDSGHIAFVANSNLTLSTLPSVPESGFEGKKGTSLNSSTQWPVVAQAGSYTGISSMVFATNGWRSRREELLKNNINFYTVKGGR
ncbi:MAG: hypothetical protein LBQ46_12635 [Treponema sp.]|jgi:hypothetical protein|nr:hypothetical protein [Treponema sp.]